MVLPRALQPHSSSRTPGYMPRALRVRLPERIGRRGPVSRNASQRENCPPPSERAPSNTATHGACQRPSQSHFRTCFPSKRTERPARGVWVMPIWGTGDCGTRFGKIEACKVVCSATGRQIDCGLGGDDARMEEVVRGDPASPSSEGARGGDF